MPDGISEFVVILKLLSTLAGTPPTQATAVPYQQPAPPQAIARPQSIGDVADVVLRCFHPTGQFVAVEVLQYPWAGGAQFRATNAVLMRIHWRGGFIGGRYIMDAGLMERDGAIRATVLGDTARIQPSPNCRLRDWVPVS